MKKKVLLKGPVLSQSGYGYQARFALEALRTCDELDIFIINTGWGRTSWLTDDDNFREWVDNKIKKTIQYIKGGGQFDIFLQVSIPNEVEHNAPVNILYTAGIETTKVAPQWIEKTMGLTKMIVVSNHAKEVFNRTSYEAVDQNTGRRISDFRNKTEIDVVNYGLEKKTRKKLAIDFDYDFNFLTVAQWGVRKNLDNTIKWFVEEFENDEVGLVVKTSIAKNSYMDRQHTEMRLKNILATYPNRKCKVYLLHGNMETEEIRSLYNHDKIKAYVTATHGEGFGLPVFEAAQYKLPIVSTGWSGLLDFLVGNNQESLFESVDYELKKVQPQAVWDGVIVPDAMWAYPTEYSLKSSMRKVYDNYETALRRAEKLEKHLKKNFKLEDKYQEFVDSVMETVKVSDDDIEDWLSEMKSFE